MTLDRRTAREDEAGLLEVFDQLRREDGRLTVVIQVPVLPSPAPRRALAEGEG